jgi:hypothetical protein
MPDQRERAGTELDRALDAALADLTAAPAPADLRPRVLARIAARPGEPRGSAFRLRWSVALPAAAAIAAVVWSGVWLNRRMGRGTVGEEKRPVAIVAPTRPAGPLGTSSVGPAPAADRGGAPPTPVRTARAAPRRRPAPAATIPSAAGVLPSPAVDDPAALPPLDPPAPVFPTELVLASTREPVPIDVPSLRVEPLAPPGDEGPAPP